jgi:outer membrane protein assembly factor BamB
MKRLRTSISYRLALLPSLAVIGISLLGAGCGGSGKADAPDSRSDRAEGNKSRLVAQNNGQPKAAASESEPIDRPETSPDSEPPGSPPKGDIGTRTQGVDWPTFLGSNADSKSPETGLPMTWPDDGPRIVWQKRLGEGYGIGSVSRGRFYQLDRIGDEARLICMNAETGENLWTFPYDTHYRDLYDYDGGPRCSPVIDGKRVYIYGVEGMLYCLNAETGDEIWKVDTAARYGVVQNFFGVGSTPVIENDLLLVMVGGSPVESRRVPPGRLDLVEPGGSAVVAFDKMTGEERYRAGDDLASYASLKLATIDGRRWCFALAREGLLGLDPASGKIDFHYPWRSRILESVNASMPVVVGDEVFISETYGPGSSLLKVRTGGYDVVWKDDERRREKALQCHWNTPIYLDGYLYGCSGRHTENGELRCIDWKTGEVKWSEPELGRTSLLYVDGHFVCMGEYGTMHLLKANPEKFEEVARWTLREQFPAANAGAPLLRYPCWAAPILSHGLLYVRGRDRLVCLELIPDA